MRCSRNRPPWMERPMGIRARASSKSHVAETRIEWHRRIYRQPKSPRQKLHSPLLLNELAPANTEIPLALVEILLQATGCEDELAGSEWPIPGVADVARCVPEK